MCQKHQGRHHHAHDSHPRGAHAGHAHHDHHSVHRHSVSRRQVLAGLGAAGLASAFAPPPLAAALKPVSFAAQAAKSSPNSLFNITRVTDGVYAAVAKPQAFLNCNAAVIVNSDHALVVDTHSKPSAARALIRQLRAEVTDRPVRYVVDSHFHWDHAQGNLAYPDAFGANVEVISSTATREWLAREGEKRVRESLQSLPNQIAEVRKQLAAAKSAGERQRLTRRVAEMEAYAKEMNPPPIKLPTLTFNDRLVLHRDGKGGKEVHLMFLGRGHTAGDIVVYVPGERVVATGDLMHGLLPYIGDGYPDEWPRTLTELEKLDFTRVVPGHGLVQEGKTILANFRAYIEEVTAAVRRGVERGDGLQALQQSISPDGLRSLAANDNVARMQREFAVSFGTAAEAPLALRASVASNVAQVYDYFTKRKGQG
jgi:cyclase